MPELSGEPEDCYASMPICPICQRETNIYLRDENWDIVGCEDCYTGDEDDVFEVNAWEWTRDSIW